jgi:hypothetical protein
MEVLKSYPIKGLEPKNSIFRGFSSAIFSENRILALTFDRF